MKWCVEQKVGKHHFMVVNHEMVFYYPSLHTPQTIHNVYVYCIIFNALWNREWADSTMTFLPSPIQTVVPILSEKFFFVTDSPYSSRVHFDTYPPGSSSRNGYHGESGWPDETEQGLMRAHWMIGPPFVDRKSMTTTSNTGALVGDKRGRPSLTLDRAGTNAGWQCGRLCL